MDQQGDKFKNNVVTKPCDKGLEDDCGKNQSRATIGILQPAAVLAASLSNFAIPYLLLQIGYGSPSLVSKIMVVNNLSGFVGVIVYNVVRPEWPTVGRCYNLSFKWLIFGCVLIPIYPLAAIFYFSFIRFGSIRSPQCRGNLAYRNIISWLFLPNLFFILEVGCRPYIICSIIVAVNIGILSLSGINSFWLPACRIVSIESVVIGAKSLFNRLSLEVVLSLMPACILIAAESVMSNDEHIIFLKLFSILGVSGVVGILVERMTLLVNGLQNKMNNIVVFAAIGSAIISCIFVRAMKGSIAQYSYIVGVVSASGIFVAYYLSRIRFQLTHQGIRLISLIIAALFIIQLVVGKILGCKTAMSFIFLLLLNNCLIIFVSFCGKLIRSKKDGVQR